MVFPHLPIDILRIVSLNRFRKFRRSFDHSLRCEERPRPDAAASLSTSDQLHSIRRRAGGADEPLFAGLDARMEHIARIRIAIAEGRYHVSAADLAQKLIDHMVANRRPKS